MMGGPTGEAEGTQRPAGCSPLDDEPPGLTRHAPQVRRNSLLLLGAQMGPRAQDTPLLFRQKRFPERLEIGR